MKITAHFNNTPFDIPVSPDDGSGGVFIWAQGAQRLVEGSFLHTQKLLPLLASLSSSTPSGVGRYKLCFGGGYVTLIEVTWIDCTSSSHFGWIEANITFKSRDESFGECLPSMKMPTSLSQDGPSASDSLHVDVVVEILHSAGGNQKQQRMGNFPIATSVLPAEQGKTNLLRAWEHPMARWMVCNYSFSKDEEVSAHWLAAWKEAQNQNTDCALRPVAESEISNSPCNSLRTERTKGKTSNTKGLNQESDTNRLPVSAHSAGTSPKTKVSTNARNDLDGPTGRKKVDTSASGSQQLLVEDKDHEGIKSTKIKVKSTSDTPSSAPQGKQHEVVSSTAATKNLHSKKKKKRQEASSEHETETPSSPKRRKLSDDDAPPKRPPNGYMVFCSEIRPRIIEQHPGLSVVEQVCF